VNVKAIRRSDLCIKFNTMQSNIYHLLRFSFSLILLFFGCNQFLHFLPAEHFPTQAQVLYDAFVETGYILNAVGIVQVILGLSLLFNAYIPLTLLLFFPILLNVILFHLCLDIAGFPKVIPTLVLYTYFIVWYRQTFSTMFKTLSL